MPEIIAQADETGTIAIGVKGTGGMIAMITGSDFTGWTDYPINEPSGSGMTSEEIALRIVACWNIYEGVATEEIEARLAILKGL